MQLHVGEDQGGRNGKLRTAGLTLLGLIVTHSARSLCSRPEEDFNPDFTPRNSAPRFEEMHRCTLF